MTKPQGAGAGTPAFATASLRSIETPTFRLVPVPSRAIVGRDARIAAWAEAA